MQSSFYAQYHGSCATQKKLVFTSQLKQIWTSPIIEIAKQRAENLTEVYHNRFPKAIQTLERGLEDALQFFSFPEIDAQKISSTNLMERLNKEVRRRTNVVGIFPNEGAYLRLVTAYLMEYSEDWATGRNYIKKESLQNLDDVA